MYSNKNNNYYRINHERNLDFFDTSFLAQFKSLLFCELAENDTATIGKNIIFLFNSILKYNNLKDKFEIIYNLSEQCYKNYDNDSLSLFFCQKLSNKKFQMSFTLSKENITDVSILLSIGLKKLNKMYKIKNKTNLNYDKFIEMISKYKNMRLNLIPFYKEYNIKNNNNNNSNRLMIQKYDLPNEILLLIDIFQKIKRLEFKIGDYNKNIINCISLILLNYEWLFPYVFEIEFDLSCNILHKEIQKIYIKKIRDKIGTQKVDGLNDEEGIENLDSDNNLKLYSNIIDLIIIYTFFIDKFKFLNNLEIRIPDSFKMEIENHLNNQKINITTPHPLKFFFSINNLNFLKIEFNALDSFTFENIFSLIQNNSNLKHLSLDFFPNQTENNNFNSLSNLLKLAEESSNDNYLLKRKIMKSYNNYTEYKKELKKILLNELIENFENNMEKLFILLQTKKNLEELFLMFNETDNIFSDDENKDFYLVLLKFIYNILIMLNKEKFLLKSIKIISKYFNFDSNKNNSIEEFLSQINYNINNKSLINFELQLQINNIINISHLISFNFRRLYLGALDQKSLSSFILFYQDKNFIQNSELFSLTIDLNENIIAYEGCKEELIKLIKSECPKKLNEIGLYCKFNINENELADLVMNGNGNCVHKYIFKIKGNNKNKNDYDNIINDKKLYYIDKIYKNSVNRYMGLIIKYKLYIGNNVKIGKKLIQFLIPNNRKIVDINFI